MTFVAYLITNIFTLYSPEMIENINKELNVFSSMGLRTLVLAKRELSRSEFEAWIEEYKVQMMKRVSN